MGNMDLVSRGSRSAVAVGCAGFLCLPLIFSAERHPPIFNAACVSPQANRVTLDFAISKAQIYFGIGDCPSNSLINSAISTLRKLRCQYCVIALQFIESASPYFFSYQAHAAINYPLTASHQRVHLPLYPLQSTRSDRFQHPSQNSYSLVPRTRDRPSRYLEAYLPIQHFPIERLENKYLVLETLPNFGDCTHQRVRETLHHVQPVDEPGPIIDIWLQGCYFLDQPYLAVDQGLDSSPRYVHC